MHPIRVGRFVARSHSLDPRQYGMELSVLHCLIMFPIGRDVHQGTMDMQGDVEDQDGMVGAAAGRQRDALPAAAAIFPPIAADAALRGSAQADAGLSQTHLRMAT